MKVSTPFLPLYGVSFYDKRKAVNAEIDGEELPWEWYIYRSAFDSPEDPRLVRAFKLEFPMRVLGIPIENGRADLVAEEGMWLIRDEQIISATSQAAFDLSFVKLRHMTEMVEDRDLWGVVCSWTGGAS